mgnify:CR=1 FL=1
MRQNTIIHSLFAIMFAVWFLFPYEVSAATIESITGEITSIEQDKVRLKALANSLVEKIESSNNPEQDMDELKNIQERVRALNTHIEKLKMARSEIENTQRKSEAAAIAANQARQQASESSTSTGNKPPEEKSGFSLWKIVGGILIIAIIAGIIGDKSSNSSRGSGTTVIHTGTPTEFERRNQPFMAQNRENVQATPPPRQASTPTNQRHTRPAIGRPGVNNPRDNGVIPEDIV